MDYTILDGQGAVQYLRNHPQAGQWLDLGGALEVAEIGDGNLNLVFRVHERDNPARSILIKQGIPYLRVAGEAWPLSPQRARFEATALRWQHQLAPGLVPQPYWFDPALNVNAMEDLTHHQVLRRPMVQGVAYPGLGATVGRFLAATLYGTSDFALGGPAKKELAAQFVNTELCQITEDLIFTEPFEPVLLAGKPNRNHFDPQIAGVVEQMQSNTRLKLEVAQLKLAFMTQGQALLHGDLHTGSIMATLPDEQGNCDIRIIDPEFAFYGPMGFDLGLFVANLLLNAAALEGHQPDPVIRQSYRQYLYRQIMDCWQAFSSGFLQRMAQTTDISWTYPALQNALVLQVLRDAVGFAGCEMVRRTVGFAHVYDLDSITQDGPRAQAMQRVLQQAQTLIMSRHQVRRIDDLLTLISSETDASGT
jgi:5-methylthioribose kinase